MSRYFVIKSMGCQMNRYDCDRIADLLMARGDFQSAPEEELADLLIINTCSVREKASEKLFSELGRWNILKMQRPQLIIAVGGCVSMEEGRGIFKRAPYVDIVFGTQTGHRLPEMLERVQQGERQILDLELPHLEKFDYFPEPGVRGASAFLSIMEGCNNFCSYCIVPYTRGREESRTMRSILKEAQQLAVSGVKEINLLGQNVNSYKDPESGVGLSYLIKQLAAMDEIERIRFTTSHPAKMGDDMVEVYASEPKLVSHLHLPVQSGSNRILQLMRRRYSREDYLTLVDKLKQARPNLAISTDIIVGFPNESEEDFNDTMDIVRMVNFDSSFSFIYSPRPYTPAAKMEDSVPIEVKKERLAILQQQLTKQAAAYSEQMVGSTQKVLVVGGSKQDAKILSGKTENNRVVNFAADPCYVGQMVQVRITEALPNSLRGELIL